MAHFNDKPWQYVSGYYQPGQSIQPGPSEPKMRKTPLAVSEMLNPVHACNASRGDTMPLDRTSPGAWSQGEGAMTPQYTYSGASTPRSCTYSRPGSSGRRHGSPAHRVGPDPAPRRVPSPWSGRQLPPMLLSPTPEGSPANSWNHDSPSPTRPGSGALPALPVFDRLPGIDELCRHLPAPSTPRTPVSPGASISLPPLGIPPCPPPVPVSVPLPGSHRKEVSPPRRTHASSRPRHNFPPSVLKVFMDKAEQKILVNDERCRLTRDEMKEMEARTNVELKKIETWFTNHRRRGYPQQMVDILHREVDKQRKAYVAAIERRDLIKQTGGDESEYRDAHNDVTAQRALLDKLIGWADGADHKLALHKKSRTRGQTG
ncbi:hypothetical protein VTI28DRAFT_3600 [Corynascus sepedonium]